MGQPFILPDSFPAARTALAERFQSARQGVTAVLGDMERLAVGLGMLSRGRKAFRNPREGFGALFKLAPMVRDWHRSVTQVFDRAFGNDEAVKCALAANLPYWHDDPNTLWWILFGVAQGGYLASGGRYVRYGSARLSNALADAARQAGGEIIMGRQVTEIRLDTDTGARPASSMPAGAAQSRRRLGRRSLSPMLLPLCLLPCCRQRCASGSGRIMPAATCRSRCSQQRSACRCDRRRSASAAIRLSCCHHG